MTLMTSALLAKAAMPWAGKLALSGFTKIVRRPRVARAAAKRAAEAGIPVTAKSLRIWLARKDTGAQLRDCSEASLDHAAGRLAFVMPGGNAEERRRDALQILRIVMEESVRAADPSHAVLLVGGWGLQTTQEEGRKTRDQLVPTPDSDPWLSRRCVGAGLSGSQVVGTASCASSRHQDPLRGQGAAQPPAIGGGPGRTAGGR